MKFFPVFLVLTVFALSACSTTSDYKGVYESAKTMDSLQVPPDLNLPPSGEGSGDAATYFSAYQQNISGHDNGQLLKNYQGMRFVRDGSEFWLEIHDSPDNVWNSLRAFFTRLGFKIVSEQPALGLMQTNYIKNLANIPSNWFLRTINKLSASGMMDSYRAHLEFDDAKKITRVFIAHQGLREVSSSDNSDIKVGDTYWEVRPTDPELEVETLMRFMAFRGGDEMQARKIVAQAKAVIKATLKQTSDGYVLQYNDAFARVWRLAGIALDRMGILIEDRNRSAGVYYMQLPDSFKLDGKSGFFESAKKPSKDKYLLVVAAEDDHTLIRVKPRGEPGKDFPEVAKKILDEIKNNLQ